MTEHLADERTATEEWFSVFDPRRSLRARVALVAGGIALIFILLLGGTAESLLRGQIERQVAPTFATLAGEIASKLDRGVHARVHHLQLAAALAALSENSAAAKTPVVESLLDSLPDCAWVGFADANGQLVATSQRVFEGTRVAENDWFRGARDRPFVSEPSEFTELARAVSDPDEIAPRFFAIAVPVRDARGKFLGVLCAQIRWSWVAEINYSVLPDAMRREKIGGTIYSSTGAVLLDSGVSGWSEPPDSPVNRIDQRDRGSFHETTAHGATYLTGYARSRGYREYRGLGWFVAVRQPTARVFTPAVELRLWVIRVGLTLTAIVTVLGWILAAGIARRLDLLTATARRIRAGDILTIFPQPRGQNEFSRLYAALGAMLTHFREQTGESAREKE